MENLTRYNFSDFNVYHLLVATTSLNNMDQINNINKYYCINDNKKQVTLANVFDNDNSTSYSVLFFNTFKGYEISDHVYSYKNSNNDYRDLLVVIDILPWQKQGLSKTSTGYGTKIETIYKVFHNGKFYRVYSDCYSNAAQLYILPNKEKLFLS